MGLCLYSGPKWEDDAFNDINIHSVNTNAIEMYNFLRGVKNSYGGVNVNNRRWYDKTSYTGTKRHNKKI